jgi:hypothetical protein
MSGAGGRLILAIYTLCVLSLYLAMASLAIVFEKKSIREAGISSALLNEVGDQWLVQPFIDAIVVNRTETSGQ